MAKLRVPDEWWAMIEPFLPPEPPKPKGERRAVRTVPADRQRHRLAGNGIGGDDAIAMVHTSSGGAHPVEPPFICC